MGTEEGATGTQSREGATDHSCLRTAWPLSVSTLKLLVRAGMMKKATTVCSLPFTWDRKEEVGVTGKNAQISPITPQTTGILT